MKHMACELCGSSDLLKQDGMYVCKYCGAKYTVEEAKKLMVEGTVKIDNSEKLKNLYALARQAKESNDAENAVKYYDMIRQEDSNSWEACFYNVYFRATQTRILYIQSAANSVENCLPTVFGLIKNGSDSDAEKKEHVSEIAVRVAVICKMLVEASQSTLVKSWDSTSNYSVNYALDYANRALACADALFKCGDLIERDYNTDPAAIKLACSVWDNGITIWKTAYGLFDDHAARYINMKSSYVGKLQKYQGSYSFTAPNFSGYPNQYAIVVGKNVNSDFGVGYTSSSGGGCYVATAVYGSYDCPQVWTLRRFRDNTLAATWYGRAFIHVYYAISPTLVKWFGNTEWFNKIGKKKLDRMVARLQSEGVESSPYEDRSW